MCDLAENRSEDSARCGSLCAKVSDQLIGFKFARRAHIINVISLDFPRE